MKKRTKKSEIKLNLGCFDKKLPGFVNVDIREDVNPDVLDNAFTLDTFDKDSVDLMEVNDIRLITIRMDGTLVDSKETWRRLGLRTFAFGTGKKQSLTIIVTITVKPIILTWTKRTVS